VDAETPDRHGAYPRLSDEQIEALSAEGQRRRTQVGDVLFEAGDDRYDFFVVLDGKVANVERDGRIISVHGPRRFLGELSLLTGQAVVFSAVVQEAGKVLAVPVDRLRALVAQDEALGDLILRAYLIRRSILIGLGAGVRIIGSHYSGEEQRVLRRHRGRRAAVPQRPGGRGGRRQLGGAGDPVPGGAGAGGPLGVSWWRSVVAQWVAQCVAQCVARSRSGW